MAKVAAEAGSTANRYEILAKLAVGGMAEIFLARGASVAGVERYCVLKRILRDRASDAQFVQMFVDEARLAAQLQHPNIASVYDVGMLGDSYFFTMEYVHGETVRSLLERAQELARPVPLACALTIIAGAASGLHHAHERHSNDGRPLGIVHRDVTPSNLMVSFEGNIKLVDFGVAKADDREVETQSGTVKGKISYLSPEQCRGERVDRRSDLFSLGIVMWEMLTGRRLYRRDSDFATLTAIVNEPPPPPSSRRSEVPRAVDDIVLRLLAKSVADRFQTADQVVEAIENASMRAGTILSISAVGRLVRDLFGVRPEPWVEFEGETTTYEPVAVSSRPLPQALAHPALGEVELDLANVLDLSTSSIVLEVDEVSNSSQSLSARSTAERLPRAGGPVAAPSPPPAPVHSRPSAPITPVAPAAHPPRAQSPTAPPSGAAVPTALPASPSAPVPIPAARSGPVASGHPPVRPSRLAIGGAPPSSPSPSSAPFASSPNAAGGPPATTEPIVTTEPAASTSWNTTQREVAPQHPWTTLLDAAPPSPLQATLIDVAPPGSPNATLLDVAPPGSPNATLIDAAPPSPPNSTLLGVTGHLAAIPAAPSAVFSTPSRLYAQSAPPVYHAAPSASNPVIAEYPTPSSLPKAAPTSTPKPVPNQPAFGAWNPGTPYARPPSMPASSVPWPLILVIIVAAAIGVGAVWLWMGTHGRRPPEDANLAREPASLPVPVTDAAIIDPRTAPQGEPPGTGPVDAGDALQDAVKEIENTPDDKPAPAAPKPPVEAPKAPGNARSPASSAPPTQHLGDSSQPAHAPSGAAMPRTTNVSPTGTSRASPDDISLPQPTPSGSAPAAASSSAPERKAPAAAKPAAPSFDSLRALYESNDFPGVVRACSATTVTATIASVCTLAACHTHDIAKAQRWLPLNPAESRGKLEARCKEFDTTI